MYERDDIQLAKIVLTIYAVCGWAMLVTFAYLRRTCVAPHAFTALIDTVAGVQGYH